MVQKERQFAQTPPCVYNQQKWISYQSVMSRSVGEGGHMWQEEKRRVPTLIERVLLAGVSLGWLGLAAFVGNLYFAGSVLPIRIAVFAVLSLFLVMIVVVNVLFNKGRS